MDGIGGSSFKYVVLFGILTFPDPSPVRRPHLQNVTVGLPLLLRNETSHRAVGVDILDSTQVRRPMTAVRSLSRRVPPKCFPSGFSRPNGHLLNGYEQIPKRGGCDDVLHSRGVPYQVNPDEQQKIRNNQPELSSRQPSVH